MSQIRLLIADRDTMYLEKLSAYLQRNKYTQFSIELFTIPEKFMDWVNKGEKADLLLISSSFLSDLPAGPGPDNTVILRDSPESLLPDGYRSINKYQPADNLMKELISLFADRLPAGSRKSEGSGNIHLVLYGDGSDIYTPLAQTLAVIKAGNKPSFYINLDEFPNTDDYFSGSNTKGLSEMLYYIKARKENLSLKAEACTSRDSNRGVDFMKGHKNPDDVAKMDASECESLISSVRERGCYDDIIISRAFRKDEILTALLSMASKIYITFSDYNSSVSRMAKISEYMSMLAQENPGLAEKTLFCMTLTGKKTLSNINIDISGFRKFVLPSPYEDEVWDQPGIDYIDAVKTMLEQ